MVDKFTSDMQYSIFTKLLPLWIASGRINYNMYVIKTENSPDNNLPLANQEPPRNHDFPGFFLRRLSISKRRKTLGTRLPQRVPLFFSMRQEKHYCIQKHCQALLLFVFIKEQCFHDNNDEIFFILNSKTKF